MQFFFATAGHIVFGAGTVVQAVREAAHMGHRALLVTGRTPGRAIDIGRQLEKAGVAWIPFGIPGEPEIEQAAQGAALARDEHKTRESGHHS
jgi:alcohol dehydrogenase class IV